MSPGTDERERERVLAERAMRLARPLGDDQDGGRTGVVVVRAGEATFGIPLERVDHIVREDAVSRFPAVPPPHVGVVNVRGRLLTAIDLSAALGLPGDAGAGQPLVVVARGDRVTAGLLVHDVVAVRSLRGDELRPPMGSGPVKVATATTEDMMTIIDVVALLDDERLEVRDDAS